ncbi:MAG TPA: antibiotic biosynthesis monooxygenase [Actinomycetota bacterium]|jgi:quinol monooxygenase YgiN
MSEVRTLSVGVAKDYEAFCRFIKDQSPLLQETEPGTLLFEVFADQDSGRVVVHERYADADAFVAHVEALMDSSRLQEFTDVYELKRLTFLTKITDERVKRVAQMLGAIEVEAVVTFDRAGGGV